jgi:hypothetical protein
MLENATYYRRCAKNSRLYGKRKKTRTNYYSRCSNSQNKHTQVYRELKEEFLGRTNCLLSFHYTSNKQFFYYCVCIRCRGNVFTEPLLINGRLFRLSGVMSHFSLLMVARLEEAFKSSQEVDTDTQTLSLISLILFFSNKQRRLKSHNCTHIIINYHIRRIQSQNMVSLRVKKGEGDFYRWRRTAGGR